MSGSFYAAGGLVLIEGTLAGPGFIGKPWLVLDTGATDTVVNEAVLVAAGYNPSSARRRVPITTPSGSSQATVVTVDSLTVLGVTRINFPVLSFTLPPSTNADGLLGLDFLRGHDLTISFKRGTITLT